ncbi:GNAT family N-acetyltransferase [Naasia sp. SYSU D00948]|uniref:GNAT family N-acetyltransferase n=1 Tax=Naasia sp. SYSU D00948 TaxID=2817379 RepID=UPI001B30133C|nr:GNAT family N-acetyltransferase [Naasia sp. SYSU D00948]
MTDTVRHEPERMRYVLERDGEVIGLTSYRQADSEIRITHTEIQPVLRGQGLGGVMVQQVLDDLRATTDAAIVPVCPFVDRWIGDHREYQDLLSRR